MKEAIHEPIQEIIHDLISRYGSQEKAASALGVNARTFRNYVRSPEAVPRPVQLGMRHLLNDSPLTPPADAATPPEVGA